MTALEKTLHAIVVGGIFLLPFIVFIAPYSGPAKIPFIDSQDMFFPFITGKNFAFRILVEIIAGSWLALVLVRPEYRPRRQWLLGIFALFVAIIGVADATGVYPYKSIWSNFERMDGWVTLAHLFAYVVVASSILTEKLWRKYWITVIVVSVLVALHALLQLFGFAALGQGGATGLASRLDATFGNPIYLAVFLLFTVFIAGILWAHDWSEKSERERTSISLIWGGVIALDTFILLFTGTRGATLGLIAGLFLTAVIFALHPRGAGSKMRKIAIGFIATLVVVGALFWSIRDSALVRKVGFLERLATISLSDATFKARVINWQTAWQGVKERPLLGWGQENYAIVFDKYYDPRMYAQEQWFDRVHNVVFDWLVAGGFLGLLAYLAIFGYAIRALWREKGAFSLAERGILTGLLAAYFLQNLTVFDNITSYLLFASVIAYIASRDSEGEGHGRLLEDTRVSSAALPIIAAVVAIAVWGAAWGVNQKAIAQNRILLRAVSPQASLEQNLALFEEAILRGSFGTQEAREQLTQGALQVVSLDVPADVKRKYYEAGVREMDAQAAVSPLDARFPIFKGVLQNAYGDYGAAKQTLEHALTLSPKKQSIMFEIAKNAQSRGDTETFMRMLRQAYELEPSYELARIYLAAALIRAGNDTEADKILEPLIKSGAAANPQIAAAYVARGNYAKIAAIWQAKVAAAPKDMQARFTLAAAYYALGKTQEAIAQLREAIRIDPSTKAQAEALIAEIERTSR